MMRPAAPEQGTVLVTVALALTALMGMAALAIDTNFLAATHGELQNTADAAALAAASGLALSPAEGQARAQAYASLNRVLQQPVALQPGQVEFGFWNSEAGQFFPIAASPNSARVQLQLNAASSPPAPDLFFAPLLGVRRSGVAARATASLGNRNLMMVLDRSGSMGEDPPTGTPPQQQPLTDTKKAAKDFLDQIRTFPVEGDRAGLVFYNQSATLSQRLTENFNQVKAAIDAPPATGCTNIAAGLCEARREIFSSTATARGVKVVILLTDGRANTRINPATCQQVGAGCADPEFLPQTPSQRQAMDQARLIGEGGGIVYTISLGNRTDEAWLQQMANSAGGAHFHAPQASDLDAIFQEIAALIPVALVE